MLQTFGPELAQQVAEPLYFVDFLREPRTDESTGEVIEARPSCYESVPGDLAEIRGRVEGLVARFNEESKALKMELVLFKGEAVHVPYLSRVAYLLF